MTEVLPGRTSPLRWVTQAFAWGGIIVTVLVLAVGVIIPRAVGGTTYTVLTSSMEPDLPPGTLVVTKPVDADQVRVGEVITYQLESGKPTTVTHRVVEARYTLNGDLQLITQGDANPVPDSKPVIAEQVRGKLWYSVPYLGRVNNWLTPDRRGFAIIGVVGILLAYAAYMFTSAVVDRRRRTPETDSPTEKAH